MEEKMRLYFTPAEGLGATYRRYMLNQYFRDLIEKYRIETVLEAPCGEYGVSGVNSLVFPAKGCKVTFISRSEEVLEKARRLWELSGFLAVAKFIKSDLVRLPFDSNTFDLVWNFIEIPKLEDPTNFIQEMARVSRKLVFIVVPNRSNYGYPIYAMHNFLTGRPPKYGSKRWLQRKTIRNAMMKLNLKIVDEGIIDIPPWPGFEALMGTLRKLGLAPPPPSKVSAEPIVGETESDVINVVKKYYFIEKSSLPLFFKTRFAHLVYVLGEK